MTLAASSSLAAVDHFPQRRIIRRLEIDGDRPYFDPNALTPPARFEPLLAL